MPNEFFNKNIDFVIYCVNSVVTKKRFSQNRNQKKKKKKRDNDMKTEKKTENDMQRQASWSLCLPMHLQTTNQIHLCFFF